MTLAIVGSVSLQGSIRTYKLIVNILTEFRALYPDLHVVSGGAKGVDSMAIQAAMALGIPWHERLPHVANWEGYKERNLLIAEDCDCLVCIVASDSKTYGSGWTRDRARELGKPVAERIIPR